MRPSLRCTLLLLALAAPVLGEVSCPAIFGNGMVLQRELPIAVWGSADPGETVTVEFAGQARTATADPAGRWRVTLDPLAASAQPRTLMVHGRNTLAFSDVLVGELWFCSGQSNMEKPLGPRSGQKPTDNFEEELRRADCPTLRLFQVPQHGKPKPGDGSLAWRACTADALTLTKFSAAAYYFGRELVRELGVPVGLIHSSFGGTRIEAWMPPAAFDSDPVLGRLRDETYPAWVKGVQPTELHASMVAPFVPFTLRGFLWYQGEANCMNAEHLDYARKLRALVRSWREAWELPDAPFLIVQLAPFGYSTQRHWAKQLTPHALPALWEAQLAALDVPHTGIVPTSDLAGSGRDIHPTNKRDVGLRLARLALAEAYGRPVAAHAPRFRSARFDGAAVEVGLDHAAGLRTADGLPPACFEVAGPDRVFHPAEAKIVSGRVRVSSPAVPRPAAVRFAWHELAMPNLVNAAGLPALPFRTDDWPIVLETPKPPPAG